MDVCCFCARPCYRHIYRNRSCTSLLQVAHGLHRLAAAQLLVLADSCCWC